DKSFQLLFVFFLLLAVPLSGYEQGSYFLFDLISSSEETPQKGRLALNVDLFVEEDSNSVLADNQKPTSEFEFDHRENFSFSQTSTFSNTNTFVFLDPLVKQDLPIETFSFSSVQNAQQEALRKKEK
ncbi:MAG: hypothetical protein AAGH40_06760, partial [Verrucomicrobiota bacterium]